MAVTIASVGAARGARRHRSRIRLGSAAVSATFSIDDLSAYQRAWFDELSPQRQQEFLESMTRLMRPEPPRRLSTLSASPEVDERQLVADTLFGGYSDSGQAPPDSVRAEFDAQLGNPDADPRLDPSGYRQPVRMLTVAQAAQLMGVSTSTVRRLTDRRGLPALRLFKTLRIRSDHAWAMGNRLAAGRNVGGGGEWSARHQSPRGMRDMGVPIGEVARTTQVHPHTLRRWWRRLASTAPPGQPPHALLWRCAGRRDKAVIPEDVLTGWGIPYAKSSLRFIRFAELCRPTPRQKRLVASYQRISGGLLPDDQVRRSEGERRLLGVGCLQHGRGRSFTAIECVGSPQSYCPRRDQCVDAGRSRAGELR
jgi:excisionase family DNA binding protein